MKAAVMEEWGRISLKETEKPKPAGDEALIKVHYAGICGTDIHIFAHEHPTAKIPLILGHEFSGEIAEVGNNTKGLKQGQKVVVQPYRGCNYCEACLDGRDNICSKLSVFGVHENGCFAEYIKVPIKKVHPIPDDAETRLYALSEPLAVAVHDVRRSGLQVGQKALILGGGPIGILIGLTARLAGAGDVVISEVNPYRKDFISNLGLTATDPREEDFFPQLMKITHGKGFDVVYEAAGVESSVAMMTKAVKIGGTVVTIGMPGKMLPFNVMECVMKELDIRGVRIHAQNNFAAAVDIIASGVMNESLEKIITHEFPMERIEEAFTFSLKDTKHMKVIIKI